MTFDLFQHELDTWKCLDLRNVAAAYGYTISTADKSKIIGPQKDTLVVKRHPNGSYSFWNVGDDKDHGTVLDFIKNRTGKDIRDVCDELRAFVGSPHDRLPVAAQELTAVVRDRKAVQEALADMRVVQRSRYLESRGIPAVKLVCWRFAGRILQDARGNIVFPHADQDGWCGGESRNFNWKSCLAGGSKGLWTSKGLPTDNKIAIGEGAIKMLAYSAMFGDGHLRVASLGGAPSPAQKDILAHYLTRLPDGCKVVSAMDNDDAGRRHADFIEAAFEMAKPCKGAFERHFPDPAFKDWPEQLVADRRPAMVRMRRMRSLTL